MTDSPTLLLRSADVYLGPPETRFFGGGYRRARHNLTTITVNSRPDGTGTISATAAVTYPENWSRKGTTNQPPHLSTVDVIALGEQVASLYLQGAYGISPSDPRVEALDSVRISAGSTPVEDQLVGFPVEATAVSTSCSTDPALTCTTFDCTVANLRLVVSLRHPGAGYRSTTITAPDATELPRPHDDSPGDLRPFASGWADRGNTATDLTVDRDTLTASAKAHFSPLPPWPPRPQDLIVDAFVVTLQVGQILLYELDGLDRADSNTLWMRQTEMRWTSPRPARIPEATTITISKARILDRGAERWRTADICGEVYGIAIRCAITHRLP
jgi:hypothetical protein